MAKVLFGWEFGAGLGHVTRMLAIVDGLRRAGHECVVAVSHLASAGSLVPRLPVNDSGTLVVQAPYWTPRTDSRNIATLSLADTLQLFRYGNPSLLSIVAQAWWGLFSAVNPDLVVADFAPTLNLAVGNACPIVVLGNGYTVPPPGRRLPPIRPWQTELPPASIQAEDDIINAVNAVRAQFGYDEVPFVADLFSGTRTFICTIPELDPYAAYRRQSYLRPFNYSQIASRCPIDQRAPNSVFLYLPPNHRFLLITLEAIASLELDCLAYIPNLPPAIGSRFGSPRMRFCRDPQPLGRIVPSVRVVVHHGGLSTAYLGLRAATPQLVLPHHLEHLVTGFGLGRLHVAAVISAGQNPDKDAIAGALRRLLEDRKIGDAAEAAATSLGDTDIVDPVASVVEECAKMLGSAG
jgi:rhamnosyltransferase subunit B